MLRIVQNRHSSGAKSYYSTADYYSEGQELTGTWHGRGAARLGLAGEVEKASWDALCDNRHPLTGGVLTPRLKSNRSVGYDFNFHVPKSVSLLYAMTRDERILDAFRASVEATMHDIEAEMKTRVRQDGKQEDRTTGNAAWGEFVHLTARPVHGVPDPHLHAHCFVFNTTWDPQESRWKAGQFRDLKRDAPYFEAVFHSRLARRMQELGLEIRRTRKAWEIEGISDATLAKFSRRTAVIEERAREAGITDAGAKGELGAKTREAKRNGLSFQALQSLWDKRLTPQERAALQDAANRIGDERIAEDGRAAMEAVELAISHCFERSSVTAERTVLAEALKRSVGTASPDAVQREFGRRQLIWSDRNGRKVVTTRSVLAEEQAMIAFARNGRGTCDQLASGKHVFVRDWLNADQRRTVEHVLRTRDRVTLIRGAAGTGKTSMMQEAAQAIEAGGTRVRVFAPSADASRGVLRQKGFANAETVARLLVDERLQSEAAGEVWWIDEAGLLGTRTLGQVFTLADRLDARIILSGDRRQHGSIERGAALRLLEEEAGIKPAELRIIERQQGEYREAIKALSEGRTKDGFERLDDLGWIREVSDEDRYRVLASDYVATVKVGKSALVVSPTHAEGERCTAEIRHQLMTTGRLGKEEHRVPVLEAVSLTEADRRDRINFTPGDVLVFHQNAKGFKKGQRVVVGEDPLPLSEAARFQLFKPGEIALAKGDLIRITRNGKSKDGKHALNNGATFTVKGFTRSGDIVLANGWTVAKHFGHLTHGYVVTSYASQGKSVDRVFIGQSSQSFPASSREQFYVSASRGELQATIFTDDKEALLEAVDNSDERLSATELVNGRAITLSRLALLAPELESASRDRHREAVYER